MSNVSTYMISGILTECTPLKPQEPRSSPQMLEKPGTIPPLRPRIPQSYSCTRKIERESPTWNVDGKGNFDSRGDGRTRDEVAAGEMTGIGCDEGAKTGIGVTEGERLVDNRSMEPCSGRTV